MKAWQLNKAVGSITLSEKAIPQASPGSVVIRMEASSLMSYMQDYVDGKLPIYNMPDGAFIPGGNGTGVIHAVGPHVWHLKPGQRVVISSHFVAQENVRNSAQILLGVTANGPVGAAIQADWRDGTLAEYAILPASSVTPVENMANVESSVLAIAMRYVVPYGGLLKGRLAAGETLVVSGATGAYGTAAVLVALAMGAGEVIALGRNEKTLADVAEAGGKRVMPLMVTGDVAKDAEAIRSLTHGGAHIAFDMVGGAKDPNMTLAALRSLVHGGRLVMMGSMAVPLPIPYTEVMLNGWEILGNFMYPRDAFRRVLDLIRCGLLDTTAIKPTVFPLSALRDAMTAARQAGGLECVVMNHEES